MQSRDNGMVFPREPLTASNWSITQREKRKKEGLNRKSCHFHPNYGQYQKLKSELKPVNKQQNTKTDYGQELLTKKFEIHGKSLVRFL